MKFKIIVAIGIWLALAGTANGASVDDIKRYCNERVKELEEERAALQTKMQSCAQKTGEWDRLSKEVHMTNHRIGGWLEHCNRLIEEQQKQPTPIAPATATTSTAATVQRAPSALPTATTTVEIPSKPVDNKSVATSTGSVPMTATTSTAPVLNQSEAVIDCHVVEPRHKMAMQQGTEDFYTKYTEFCRQKGITCNCVNRKYIWEMAFYKTCSESPNLDKNKPCMLTAVSPKCEFEAFKATHIQGICPKDESAEQGFVQQIKNRLTSACKGVRGFGSLSDYQNYDQERKPSKQIQAKAENVQPTVASTITTSTVAVPSILPTPATLVKEQQRPVDNELIAVGEHNHNSDKKCVCNCKPGCKGCKRKSTITWKLQAMIEISRAIGDYSNLPTSIPGTLQNTQSRIESINKEIGTVKICNDRKLRRVKIADIKRNTDECFTNFLSSLENSKDDDLVGIAGAIKRDLKDFEQKLSHHCNYTALSAAQSASTSTAALSTKQDAAQDEISSLTRELAGLQELKQNMATVKEALLSMLPTTATPTTSTAATVLQSAEKPLIPTIASLLAEPKIENNVQPVVLPAPSLTVLLPTPTPTVPSATPAKTSLITPRVLVTGIVALGTGVAAYRHRKELLKQVGPLIKKLTDAQHTCEIQ